MGANAQTSVPAFTAGQVLTAAQVTQINTGIPVFASSTERDAAFGGTGEKTLAEGQMAYLEDTNALQYYDGTAWQATGGSYVAKAEATTTQVVTSATPVDLTSLSVTFTAVANRYYKISLMIPQVAGNAADRGYVSIYDDTASAAIQETFTDLDTYGNTLAPFVVKTFTAGSRTIKAQAARDVGANPMNFYAAATAPATILVEDLGPT
jgi:hypothetical protein